MTAEIAGEGSWGFILDGKGVVVAHPDSAYLEELHNFYLSYRPVILNGVSEPWYVLSLRDRNTALGTRNTVILAILASSAVIVLAALVVVFFIARNISSPVKAVHGILGKIREGDLTEKAAVRSRDEIGEMTRLLNQTQEGIGSLIISIKEHAAALQNIGMEFSMAAQESASLANTIASHTEDMKTLAGSQANSTAETNTTIKEVIIRIENLNGSIESQSQSIQYSISGGIAQINSEVQRIQQISRQNKNSIDTIIGEMTKFKTAR